MKVIKYVCSNIKNNSVFWLHVETSLNLNDWKVKRKLFFFQQLIKLARMLILQPADIYLVVGKSSWRKLSANERISVSTIKLFKLEFILPIYSPSYIIKLTKIGKLKSIRFSMLLRRWVTETKNAVQEFRNFRIKYARSSKRSLGSWFRKSYIVAKSQRDHSNWLNEVYNERPYL